MNKALSLILSAGFVIGSYATDARVAIMGRQDAFYRDEVSIFQNPADISLYSNMIYGSFGSLPDSVRTTSSSYRTNFDTKDPFFGATASYALSDKEDGPAFSFGAVFNRRDPLVNALLKAVPAGDSLDEPIGKVDLIFGYNLGNGMSVGLGMYGAHQKVTINNEDLMQTGVYKGTIGLNWDLGQGLDFEASINSGKLKAIGVNRFQQDSTVQIADDYFFRGDLRLFSAVPSLNGAFVPSVSGEFLNIGKTNIMDVAGGIGLNINIDRGFFFTGLQGIYRQEDKSGASTSESIGARVSFGIERNIIWDWFLIRVGGQKEITYVTDGPDSGKWMENDPSDATDNDLVGLGFGINIDNRFRADFVAAEDIAYTFTNLISGPQHHLFNRVSATYRF